MLVLAPPISCVPATQATQPGRRAILISFDALAERRAIETVDSVAIPNFRGFFTGAACAAYALPAFPSVTAPGHASLWTGAYGNVNGIAANWQPRLPRGDHTLLEGGSGFAADALLAEPLWISAARSGRVIVAHHVTQAPGAPGYPAKDGTPDAQLLAARERAAAALARPNVHVLNGYNRSAAPDILITENVATPRPAVGWRGLGRLGARTLPPLEIAWKVGADSVFAIFHGEGRYTHVLVARERDTRAGTIAAATPAEHEPFAERELARHFSEPIEIPVEGGRVFLRVRLFKLAPDASAFLLYQPELHVVEGNRPEVAAAFDAAVGGWVGNGVSHWLADGGLGDPIWRGGDGTAEARYIESLELLARQSMLGAEWAWNELGASLLLDYFALIDEVDHTLYGWVVPGSPHYDPGIAARVQAVRARAWSLADMRLGALRRLVAADTAAALFVSGDHGMRATWRVFRPNIALVQAGLLAADSAGRIDLSRTRALSPNGYWVSVNRTAWKGGIVPPAEETATIDAAERALLAVRSSDGKPVVTRIWRASEDDPLGLGGPVGGDLYFGVADGFRWSDDARGAVTSGDRPSAGHGFPSTDPDMHTVLCVEGRAFKALRSAAARTIDAAPTVAEWLGMNPPVHAVGESVLGALMGNR